MRTVFCQDTSFLLFCLLSLPIFAPGSSLLEAEFTSRSRAAWRQGDTRADAVVETLPIITRRLLRSQVSLFFCLLYIHGPQKGIIHLTMVSKLVLKVRWLALRQERGSPAKVKNNYL